MKPLVIAVMVLGIVRIGHAQSALEPQYLEATSHAMDRMMADMNVAPAGDVDADFVAMMVPHHRGAIEMAQAELKYGRNETLRRISQGIVVEQLQEIEAMRLALGTTQKASAASVEHSMQMMPRPDGHHEP
jgi:uncharacterized protein (DUF305 family)